MCLPKIFLSCDDKFYDFAIPVILAWRKFFPTIQISLTLVSDFPEKLNKLNHFGVELHYLQKIPQLPIQNLAKIARLYSITQETDHALSMVEDIDTAPLQSQFLERVFNEIDSDKLLAVGHEVYRDMCPGKFPMSNFAGPSYLFKKLLNPKGLDWVSWVNELCKLPIEDGKEIPSNRPDDFSDESLVRRLINIRGFGDKIKKIERNVDIHRSWIDRSWWGIDCAKLHSNGYVLVNFLRPCLENFYFMKPVFDFIYEKDVTPDDL